MDTKPTYEQALNECTKLAQWYRKFDKTWSTSKYTADCMIHTSWIMQGEPASKK